MLLWYGSRLHNFAGILSSGFKFAPKEAPATGYMFGKVRINLYYAEGVYFTDMVSKSANYCFASKSNPVGVMILCDVALGAINDKFAADHNEQLPAHYHR
jgi:poly [ADP-ribose] polymerase